MNTTLAEIEKSRAALSQEKTRRITEHAAWLKSCEAQLKTLDERTAFLLKGVDLARIDRARAVLELRGDPTEVVRGRDSSEHNRDVRSNAVTAARRALADNSPKLKTEYIGVKNYSGFGDQREDHGYGMGPRHGTIVFSIGLTPDARKRELTAAEIEDALYLLHVWPELATAKKAAA